MSSINVISSNRFVSQMDLKLAGLPLAVVCEALDQSTTARLEVLEIMRQCIARPRPDAARYHSHPISQLVSVPPHLRSQFIGASTNLTLSVHYLLLRVHVFYTITHQYHDQRPRN